MPTQGRGYQGRGRNNNRGNGGRGNRGNNSSGYRGKSNKSNTGNRYKGNSSSRGYNSKGTYNQSKQIKFATSKQQDSANFATYTTIEDAITDQIQKTYTNGYEVAQSLRDKKAIDYDKKKPVLEQSQKTNAEEKAHEQKQMEILFHTLADRWATKKEEYENGMHQAYSLIKSNYCTKAMREAIKTRSEYDSKINNNPIALLEAINELRRKR